MLNCLYLSAVVFTQIVRTYVFSYNIETKMPAIGDVFALVLKYISIVTILTESNKKDIKVSQMN